jgi:hypothetical protein
MGCAVAVRDRRRVRIAAPGRRRGAGRCFLGIRIGSYVRLAGGRFFVRRLADGRIVTLVDDTVFTESASGSAIFNALGTLAGADVSPGAFATAFVRVSPDGSRIAVGNNGGVSFGNFQVGVFDLNGLNGGWYPADHFDAAWIDNQQLALTGGTFGQPARVIALDTVSPFATPTIQTLIEGHRRRERGRGFRRTGQSLHRQRI